MRVEKDIQEMLEIICAQNDYIIQVVNKIVSENEELLNVKIHKESLTPVAKLSEKLNEHFYKKELTNKQYILLKHHLKHPYVNDAKLASGAGVSYSSMAQWKSKNKLFREIYNEIKTQK